jgi:hypothetical protein
MKKKENTILLQWLILDLLKLIKRNKLVFWYTCHGDIHNRINRIETTVKILLKRMFPDYSNFHTNQWVDDFIDKIRYNTHKEEKSQDNNPPREEIKPINDDLFKI